MKASEKHHIQQILDEMVDKQKKQGTVGTYYGAPLEEFTREELLAVISELGCDQQLTAERHRTELHSIK